MNVAMAKFKGLFYVIKHKLPFLWKYSKNIHGFLW